MAEIKMDQVDDASFDVAEMEHDNQALELHSRGLIARPNEMNFVAKLKPIYLSIAHGVGKLSQLGFQPGELVLNNEVSVYSPPKQGKKGAAPELDVPAIVTVISATQFWKEVTKFGTGDLPRTWATEAEANAAGMLTVYPKWGSGGKMPDARPAMNMKLMIKEPEGVSDRSHFLIEACGAFWAPCTMIADKGSFEEVQTALTSLQLTHAPSGVMSANVGLSTRNKLAKTTGNYTWVPALRVMGTKSPSETADMLAKIGG
jgi:hypothetical protein